MTSVPTLADLIAPLEVSQFHDEVQGRSFRVFPGPPGRFAGLVTWAELDRVLCQHRLEFPRLRLALDGEVVPAHTYTDLVATRRNGLVPRLRAAQLTDKLRQGATLVLDSVEEMFEPVTALAANLEHQLRERIQVNLYAGWGTTHGFDVHWDDHDAFILQVAGRKRWRMHGVTRPSPLQRDVELPPRPTGDPAADFVLEEGDVLYVPRGHWHDVSAIGVESLHLTIGANLATGVDLLAWLADRARTDPFLREDLPRFADPGVRLDRSAQLRKRVTELLTDDVVDRFFADRDAQAPARGHIGLPWVVTPERLADGDDAEVRLVVPRAVVSSEGGTVTITAEGKRLVFATAAEPVLTALLDGTPRSVGWLAEHTAPELGRATLRALLRELITHGVVAPL